jgi:pyridoxal phosphate enzyme (YggS family)
MTIQSASPASARSALLASRLAAVRERIAAACNRANRPTETVTLIAVSKTHPVETVLDAVALGQTQFGENRIEEAAEKIAAVRTRTTVPLSWHMIGHVQSRKARDVVGVFDYVHSLDSVKLAERYSRMVIESNHQGSQPMQVLLEMNVSGEASKEGFAANNWRADREIRDTLWAEVRRIIELPGIRVAGLMTMAPIVERAEQVRPVFAALRGLRDALAADFSNDASWQVLSMGMTDDYEVAIEEGATMVRIGRAIFGPRDLDLEE